MIAIVLAVLCLVGAFSNVTLIGVIAVHYGVLGTTPNVFVLQMAVVDALACCVTYPYAAYTLANVQPVHQVVCSILGYLLMGHRIASIMSAAIIATNRCIKVTQKQQVYQQLFTQVNVRFSIVIMWSSTGLLLVPLIAAGKLGFNKYLGYCLYTHNNFTNWMYVNIGLHSCVLTILLLWTLVCYLCIIIKLRRSHQTVVCVNREPPPPPRVSVISLQNAQRLSPSAVQITTGPKFLAIHDGSCTVSGETGSIRSFSGSEEHKRRVIPCLIVVWVSIFVCWAPQLICSLFPANIPSDVHAATLCVSCISTIVNPLLYGAYNRNIRDACRRRNRVNVV